MAGGSIPMPGGGSPSLQFTEVFLWLGEGLPVSLLIMLGVDANIILSETHTIVNKTHQKSQFVKEFDFC